MKILHSWLQEYVAEPLPSAPEIAEKLTMHAFEIEGVEILPDGDAIIDVDVLPNRAHDCLSHWGIAREVAALFSLSYKEPALLFSTDESLSSTNSIVLTVEDSQLVPRATKRLIGNVRVASSPEWLRTRLEKLGQRSINNVVDITNYIVLETGQPIHTFDFDKVSRDSEKKQITIRAAQSGEAVTTLDGKEFVLTPEMLVIADETRALDIAGIKGGADSGIDENTTRIILSACTFNQTRIRKTSRALGLSTDASKRFEQGISPELAKKAANRACALFSEVCGASIASDMVDAYPRPRRPYLLGVSVDEVNRLLGTTLSEDDVADVLRRLGYSFNSVDPEGVTLTEAKALIGVPYKYGASVSFDAPDAFDCSSFVTYVFSRAGIALPRMANDQYVFCDPVEQTDLRPGDLIFASRDADGTVEHIDSLNLDQTRRTKTSVEFMPGTELANSVDHNGIYLGNDMVIHASGLWDKGQVVVEKLSESKGFANIVGLRRVPGLSQKRFVVTIPPERLDLMAARSFLASGTVADLVEEIGRVWGYNNIEARPLPENVLATPNKNFYYANRVRDALVELGFIETPLYSFSEKGEVAIQNPLAQNHAFMRTELGTGLRTARESAVYYKDFLCLPAVRIFEIGTVFSNNGEQLSLAVAVGGVKQKQSAALLVEAAQAISTVLGVSFEPNIEDDLFETDLTALFASLPDPVSYDNFATLPAVGRFSALSSFPFVLRDVAFWADVNVSVEQAEAVVRKSAGPLLVRSALFDRFEKEGQVSYAFHLVFQSPERTLTDAEVAEAMASVTSALAASGWNIR